MHNKISSIFLYSMFCWCLYNSSAAWEIEECIDTEQKTELFASLDNLSSNIVTFICDDITVPSQSNHIPLSQELVTASQTTSSAGSVISTVSGSSISAVQASRTMSVAQILTCRNYTVYEGEALDWQESPTQLALGSGLLRHAVGAVVGNMGIIIVSSAVLAELAHWKGAETLRFPGITVMPVLLLSEPTTTAATTMMRYGNASYKTIGGATIALQVAGGGLIGWLMWPSNFKAQFDLATNKWVDVANPGYAKKYSLLFKDYRAGRNGFIIMELGMNVVSGMLAAYIPEQTDCSNLAWIAAAFYGSYTIATISLMPYIDTVDKIYFTVVPIAQTVPLLIYANSDMLDEPTSAQEVASTIPVVLYWVIALRSVYDLALGIRFIYKYYHRVRHPFSTDILGNNLDIPLVSVTSNPLDANGGI